MMMMSRDEKILKSIIDKTPYTDKPQSRIEELLLELKSVIESGGEAPDTYTKTKIDEKFQTAETETDEKISEVQKTVTENSLKISNLEKLEIKKITVPEQSTQGDGIITVEGKAVLVAGCSNDGNGVSIRVSTFITKWLNGSNMLFTNTKTGESLADTVIKDLTYYYVDLVQNEE